ncbi:MAG TPA: TetR/AcrR family transcriptional regulator [bacterium]|nr:TetR/AcrR family transcriptional regulator [bacterium]
MRVYSSAIKNDKGIEVEGNRTREKIFNAAELLFIEHGYDGVSINDIAVSADVAKGLVFYYFESKKKLFDMILDRYYIRQADALMSAIGTTGNVRERIHAGIDAYLDFVEKNPGYPRLIQREVCSSEQNLEKVMQYMTPMQGWGESIFADLLPSKGPLSSRHFFITIFGMAINYYTYVPVLKRLWAGDPMAAEALSERRTHIHFVIDALMEKFAIGKK